MTGADATLFVRVIPEWLELVSLSLLTGGLVCLLWVVEPEPGDGTLIPEVVLGGVRRLLGWGVVALLLSTVAGLLVRSAGMSGYPLIRVFAVLPTVILRTHFGHAWILRIVAIVALSLTIVATGRYRHSRSSRYVMLGWALIVSALDSASGHASDAGDFSVPELMDWLHLVAAMVWGGSLVVLSIAILPRMCNQGDRAARSIARIAKRLSRIAGLAVAFVAVTALYQEWAYGGSVQGLAGSAYGRIIIVKVVLFFLLLLLGAWNRYVSVPRLQERAGFETEPSVAARFRRTVAFEAILFVAVLLCAALLRHEMPARHAASRDRHALAGWDGAGSARRPQESRRTAHPCSSNSQIRVWRGQVDGRTAVKSPRPTTLGREYRRVDRTEEDYRVDRLSAKQFASGSSTFKRKRTRDAPGSGGWDDLSRRGLSVRACG